MQPIFLKPVLQEKIWGGKKLQTEFNLTLPSDKIGESWSISAHPNGQSTVISPAEFQGMTLAELYAEHTELFHQQTLPTFPLLIKILDASDDLSIQVHPDDAYGLEHEHELGKNECWYVISAEPGAKIIYGHTAQTKEEFVTLIQEEKWNELFTEVPVKAGDFFNVPSGTIHAIGKGIVILETQQNSDTTYRVYDYDRKDDAGNPRPLHIPQTIDVTTIPHQLPSFEQIVENLDDATITHFITNHYFSVWKWEIDGNYHTTLDDNYYLATVIEGEGTLEVNGESFALKKADSFILPTPIHDVTVKGNLTLIVSRSEE